MVTSADNTGNFPASLHIYLQVLLQESSFHFQLRPRFKGKEEFAYMTMLYYGKDGIIWAKEGES